MQIKTIQMRKKLFVEDIYLKPNISRVLEILLGNETYCLKYSESKYFNKK